ncbi:MAG: FAD-binding oxidoreductase [Deltaproteobacteria bacterium]|jgi:Na+-transporting NADH:ubiquinone oxidoreductase subunit F|nr:FAD-binding oxidoreductase [Deltaproteobacteria bacterium]
MNIILGIILFILLIEILLVIIFISTRLFIPQKPIKVSIKDKTFEVNAGEDLLSALYAEDIFIPSACGGQGTCGYCKVKVKSGGGRILPIEKEFIDKKEVKKGARLACQLKLMEDIELDLPAQYLDAKEYEAKLVSTKMLTPDIKELVFNVDAEDFCFQCGQYVQIKIPCKTSLNGYEFRAYSVACAENENCQFTLTVKLVDGGLGSTWLHRIEESKTITFTGPYGEWEFKSKQWEHLVLIGGGVGMAPLKSIVDTALEQKLSLPVSLYFGARTKKDLFYFDYFKELESKFDNFSSVFALSDEKIENWHGKTGFIHQVFAEDFHFSKYDKEKLHFFLCGPPPMIDGIMEILSTEQIPEDQIFYDKF